MPFQFEAVKVTTNFAKGSFTHDVNDTVFVRDTFDLFTVMCKQCHKTALNPLNGTKQ